MATMNYFARDYALYWGHTEEEVVDKIRSGEINGFEDNGFWYVKVDSEVLKAKTINKPDSAGKFPLWAWSIVAIALGLIAGVVYQFSPSDEDHALEAAIEYRKLNLKEYDFIVVISDTGDVRIGLNLLCKGKWAKVKYTSKLTEESHIIEMCQERSNQELEWKPTSGQLELDLMRAQMAYDKVRAEIENIRPSDR